MDVKEIERGVNWICVTVHKDEWQAAASTEQTLLTVLGNLIIRTDCSFELVNLKKKRKGN